MTDKERLEDAKLMAEMLRVETRLPHDFPFDLVDWLVEQAELVGYFARKNGELNEFLNKYVEPKHLGKNVIDVAMDIIVKQSERVQELEELVEGYKIELMIKDNAKKRANQQNKRYREALERIKDNVPLEFEHKSEYEAKKNVIRLMNIQKEVDEALEDEE